MKKTLTLLLLFSLVFSFALCFSAQNVDVTVGQKFEWNQQKETPDTMKAWGLSGGKSPDGLWKYQIYVLAKKIYIPVVHSPVNVGFAWAENPGDTGIGYARVRDYGRAFHPAEAADIVKVFTCPSGGTVTVDTSIARAADWVSGSGTPVSLAIYLEDQLVYPTSGDYDTITSSVPKDISFDLEVSKNQNIYFRIGCVDGDQGGDTTIMSNVITYKGVNDKVADVETTTSTDTGTKITKTFTVTLVTEGGVDVGSSDVGSGMINTGAVDNTDDGGSNMGLIIGIVAGVAVVAAVVVVLVLKKKK